MLYSTFQGHTVSSDGRVFNSDLKEVPYFDRNGYKSVTLKGKKYYVHRIVAGLFCDGYQETLVVDHIDGDTQNNDADNLRWVTLSQNSLNSKPREKSKNISDEVVLVMLDLKNIQGLNNTQIANVTGVDRRNVSRILNGRSRSKLTGIKRNASI